jgi:hypothetical protein
MSKFSSGDSVVLNGAVAEVIKMYTVGDIEYLRAYIEDEGVKTVCVEDVEVERVQSRFDELGSVSAGQLHPEHSAVSADWFDLRSQALRLRIAHEQGQLLWSRTS